MRSGKRLKAIKCWTQRYRKSFVPLVSVGVLMTQKWNQACKIIYCLHENKVIRHLLRRQLLRWWYLGQQRVRVSVMIGFLVRGRVRIKIRIRVRVRVGVTFNVSIYHRSKCRTFENKLQIHWFIRQLFDFINVLRLILLSLCYSIIN